MMQLGVITILPDMFDALKFGVVGKALDQGVAKLCCWNPRNWSLNEYRQVDDRPYGGGPGMVMMYEPLHAAILHAKQQLPGCKTVYLSPQGQNIEQKKLKDIADAAQPVLFIAGRYEGIDERIIQHDIDEEWSIGDFVLSGGELAAMVFIDAIIRLLPGSLGHPASAAADSFMQGLLDYPQYTRPAVVNSTSVPEVLLSGSHQLIERWQRKQALGQTWLKRPDLLKNVNLTETDKQLLKEFQLEWNNEE
ncbi:MAG: tRNA (guanosine(37)-N1)-methyltransferase TrmD [Gammaproteobacteria bacterium]